MSELKEMPLFPLNTVLFPGMVLPLHIFEPRYRMMIGECIKGNQPFGVVLIREGVEVGGEAVPHEIGTSAYVTHAQRLPDGRMNIHSVGYRRFRIRELKRNERPFLLGVVEDFPFDEVSSTETRTLTADISTRLQRFLKEFSEAADTEINIEKMPDDGLGLALFAAIALPLPTEEKQELLATADLLNLLRREDRVIRRELMLLKHMRQHEASQPPDSEQSPHEFSSN